MEGKGLRRQGRFLLSTSFSASAWNEKLVAVQSHLLLLDFYSNPLLPSPLEMQKSNLCEPSAHITVVWFPCRTCLFFLSSLIVTFLLNCDLHPYYRHLLKKEKVTKYESKGEDCLPVCTSWKIPKCRSSSREFLWWNPFLMLLVFSGNWQSK